MAEKWRGCMIIFMVFYLAVFVHAEYVCPQQKGGNEDANKKARNLAGTREFKIYDKDAKYEYIINLCKKGLDNIAIEQHDLKTKTSNDTVYVLGNFKGAHVYGGNDWLIIQYTGAKYNNHCNNKNRISILYIGCDQSATTHKKRKPRIIEEYRPDERENDFCYYLFEMKHNGVCPPEKSKISPGSVFIIIIAIIIFLYLLLGFLYQRFIVGAKGMEQIPNYLMWREFGALQADGCNYICRGRGRKEPTRYKPMDDAIADDDFSLENDDNDDTMLPM